MRVSFTSCFFVSLVVLCLFVGAAPVMGQCEVAHLTFDQANPYDRLGASVAIDGTNALAGAHDAQGVGPDTGAAYIFNQGALDWELAATLAADDGLPYDLFGLASDLQGDVAVVGAPSRDDLGSSSGAAYVFRFDGGSWVQEQKLLASDGAEDDSFGGAVAIDGDTIVVGAFSATVLGMFTGAAYVFRYDGTTWVEEAKLTASDPQLFDNYGWSVSIFADWVLVGSPWHTDGASSAGAAYLYRYNGVGWADETKLLASDAGPGDFFGFSVDLDGDVAVIGAVENCFCSIPPGPLGSGGAYVFRYNGAVWAEETKLLPSGGQPEQWFGASSSISGDTVIVGAIDADGAELGTGAAYVYQYDGVLWSETAVLNASDGAGGDSFGTSVSVRGDLAMVGAPTHDDGGLGTGAAYVFGVSPSGCDSFFVRGDCNGDGVFDISDPITLLVDLFIGGDQPLGCRDACDSNDDGALNIGDPIGALFALFGTPPVPLPPPAVCGPDPTPDSLPCLQYAPCP